MTQKSLMVLDLQEQFSVLYSTDLSSKQGYSVRCKKTVHRKEPRLAATRTGVTADG